MQLKLRRSQRDGGVILKTVVFCLDARAQFTPDELANIHRYKLGSQVIYNSQASRRHLEAGERAAATDTTKGYLKQIGRVVLAAMNLNITINSLQNGQHIECKDLEELLAAEEALMTACKNLKAFLDIAACFNGREVVFDFSGGGEEPAIVTPSPPLSLGSPDTAGSSNPRGIEANASSTAAELQPRGAPETEGAQSTPPPSHSYHSATETTQSEFVVSILRWWNRLTSGQKIAVTAIVLLVLILLYNML
jgi:hypothetical protein